MVWPLLAIAAAVLVAFGFIVGQVFSTADEPQAAPETLALQSPACAALDVTVQRLLGPTDEGPASQNSITSQTVAQLKDQLPDSLHQDADNLITLYSRIESGDIAALNDTSQVSAAENSAIAITNYLATKCGVGTQD